MEPVPHPDNRRPSFKPPPPVPPPPPPVAGNNKPIAMRSTSPPVAQPTLSPQTSQSNEDLSDVTTPHLLNIDLFLL
jgi:hypothetical protein